MMMIEHVVESLDCDFFFLVCASLSSILQHDHEVDEGERDEEAGLIAYLVMS